MTSVMLFFFISECLLFLGQVCDPSSAPYAAEQNQFQSTLAVSPQPADTEGAHGLCHQNHDIL